MKRILAINPGSTSTKIAVFHDIHEQQAQTVDHASEELQQFTRILDQLPLRMEAVRSFLDVQELATRDFDAFVGRGGLLRPIPGGTYVVSPVMVHDLRTCKYGAHASNLGALIADQLAAESNCPAFIVDPVVVDELEPIARITGRPDIEKRSIFHALNQKAVAKRFALMVGSRYEDLTLIVAHLGGGISIGCHRKGFVVDVNNALDGSGPFSPERAGTIQAGKWTELLLQKDTSLSDALKMISGRGGLVAHLGTSNVLEVEQKIKEGDEHARLIYDAMIYGISREIGAAAVAAEGKVDGIILTGRIAHSQYVTGRIEEYVRFIGHVHVMAGENEMMALAEGAWRVLCGHEVAREYSDSIPPVCHDPYELAILSISH